MRTWQSTGLGVMVALALSSLAGAEPGPDAPGDPAEARGAAREQTLEAARAELAQARLRSEQARVQLADLEREHRAWQERLTTDGRTLYRLSRHGLLPIAAGLEGLLGHASRLERLERVVRADLKRLDRVAYDEQRTRSDVERSAKQIADAEQRITQLEQAQIAAIQQQIAQNLAGAGARPEPTGTGRMSYGLSLVGGGEPRARFADQRGELALPVSGPSSIRDARRAESGGPGLEFQATPGAAIRAVAEGPVA
jgi:hypothetical protein